MTKTKCIGSLAAMVMGLIMLAPGVSAKAFGIAPPYIVNDNLKPGSSFVYVIDLNTLLFPQYHVKSNVFVSQSAF